jgi:5-(carboxyamino)imidazole ribonucleotide synthase
MQPLRPGATIGILGGGQLGRMLAQAAARLGLQCHVFSSEADACSFQVVQRSMLADFSDKAALEEFARGCDVITYEFENVPAPAALFLAKQKPVLPDPRILETTQDRLLEKTFIRKLRIPTAAFAPIDDEGQLAAALSTIGVPAVLKTRRLGYDGKGQAKLRSRDDAPAAWRNVAAAPSILEAFVNFECEVSVIAARARDGKVACFDVTQNEHRDHILRVSRAPAKIPASLAKEAHRIAGRIAKSLGYVGVLGVEMFVVRAGRTRKLLVNEIAPRVHNSGHWTLDASTVSQFEQHIRAIAGWPLAKPVRHSRAEMINLIGAEVNDSTRWLRSPGVAVHLYGKEESRPGRKMGHVTKVFAE